MNSFSPPVHGFLDELPCDIYYIEIIEHMKLQYVVDNCKTFKSQT